MPFEYFYPFLHKALNDNKEEAFYKIKSERSMLSEEKLGY